MGLSWLPGLSAADVSGHLGVSEKQEVTLNCDPVKCQVPLRVLWKGP